MADPFGDRSTDISSLLELALPGRRARSVERVGEGVDHLAYEVDGELIVRCAKAADSPARRAQVRQESRVLALVMPLSPPAEPPAGACCHNDLGIEHILAEPNRLDVTGIIDWSDAAIADPAYDLALIYRDLGSDALTAILDHYAPDHSKSFRQRVEFYARCSVFEDVGYGLRPGHDAYLAQARAALHRLF
jgi:Phosphotransferase enzyme family